MSDSDRRIDDPAYLRGQYGDGEKLAARIALHERFSQNPVGWHEWLFDAIAPKPGEELLEVGCGRATFWCTNARRVPEGASLKLTDVSEGMLECAREEIRSAGLKARFEVMDVQRLDMPDASVDVVVAGHMLYHVQDLPRAIGELRRVLRPDGRAIVTTNGRDHLSELDDLIARFTPFGDRIDARKFGLESGTEQLLQSFGTVEQLDYEDSLRVTDARALADYVLSMSDAPSADDISKIVGEYEQLVSSRDGFLVTKSSGAFVCRP